MKEICRLVHRVPNFRSILAAPDLPAFFLFPPQQVSFDRSIKSSSFVHEITLVAMTPHQGQNGQISEAELRLADCA